MGVILIHESFNVYTKILGDKLNNSITLSLKPPLLDDILFLDGVTRAGKFMLGKVVSNFERMDYFHYVAILEHLPLLAYNNILDRQSTLSMMQLYLNQFGYDRMIGRGLNCRPDDSSSILNATDSKEYFERMKQPAYIEAVNSFKAKSRLLPFLIHDCLSHYSLFKDAFPKMKMINIQRHPVDLVHSWYKRGWGRRLGVDPLAFTPMFSRNGVPHSWFATHWDVPLYEDMAEIDRVTRSIVTLARLDQKSLVSHGKDSGLLVVCYEHIFCEPFTVLKEISKFVERVPLPNMDAVLTREEIPAKSDLKEDRQLKFVEIKKKSSTRFLNDLIQTSREYEEKWNLNPIYY
jgi:hypothetical protein